MYPAHRKPPFNGEGSYPHSHLAFGIEGHTVLLLIMSKDSFLFRKQKSTAEHTASIHKIIYGTDN